MQKFSKTRTQNVLAARHHRKIWLRIAGAMMAAVVFVTTYMLILPALTMESRAYCGIEEHTHSEGCYTVKEVPLTELICSPEEDADFILHTHDENCYDGAGRLICTLTERKSHTHGDDCYDENGELICNEIEIVEHTHSDECYTEQTCLSCELEESEEHTHQDKCYTTESVLSCGQVEIKSHQHTAECIKESGVSEQISVLTCTKDEHTHSDECFDVPEYLTFTYEDDLATGVITVPWDDRLPDDLTCTVIPVDEDDESYDDMLYSVDGALSDDSLSRLDIQLYRIEWQSGGKEYTLPDGVTATVELTLLEEPEDIDGMSLTGIAIDEKDDESAVSTFSSKLKSAVKSLLSGNGSDTDAADADEDDSSDDIYDVNLVTMDVSLPVYLASNSSFGVAAVSTTTTVTNGNYYKRVQSADELKTLAVQNSTSGSAYDSSKVSGYTKFVIVYNNGSYALEGTTLKSNYSYAFVSYPQFKLHKVQVSQVAGNTDYYTITELSDGTVYSPTTESAQHYILETQHPNYIGNSDTVYLMRQLGASANAWAFLEGGNREKFSNGWLFDYNIDTQDFFIRTGENGYLGLNIDPANFTEAYSIYADGSKVYDTDAFSLDITSETTELKVIGNLQSNSFQPYSPEVSIYYYSSATLTIPDVNLKYENETILPHATKPTYSTTEATPSSSLTGTDSESGYKYSSDGGTSDIEKLFSGNELTLAEQKANDGRIATDKSVVYGDDDYNAFDDYKSGEFSVTLSALGQEWTISDEENISSPIDVVFVLDVSGTMGQAASTNPDIPRWLASINAVNDAIEYVLESNPNNRIGVVSYASQAKTVIPLGRYVVDKSSVTSSGYADGFLSYYINAEPQFSQTTYDAQFITLASSPGLCEEKEGQTGVADTTKKCGGVSAYFKGNATYQQLGIQQAYQTFVDAASTTVDYKLSDGQTVTVQRQPVIIHLTDGEPSYATFNYMDPAKGPRFGTGGYGESGMLGYYSILTANYFKNMLSIYYDKQATFYSIGIGVYSEGSRSYMQDIGKTNYYVDDAYRRAVLDPSSARLAELATEPDYSSYGYTTTSIESMSATYHTASELLYNMLTGSTPNYNYIQNTSTFYDVTVIEQWLRGMPNPFTKDFSFCDQSFFYTTFTQKDLETAFESIVDTVTVVNNYGFLLKDKSSITFTDPLGEGMEVKGTPVLSYFGTLYKNPTKTVYDTYVEYSWSATATRQTSDSKGSNIQLDLSVIKARVYTDGSGNQTVKFIIPNDVVPTLYPDLYKTFYYEELPVRLIYKVGLTEGAESELKVGESKTYYTNAFDSDDSGQAESGTYVNFIPDSSNPYYFGDTDPTKDVEKTENTTDTSPYSFQEYVSGTVVSQMLGNNGSITLTATPTRTITKKWDGVETQKDVTVWLFREKVYGEGITGDTAVYSVGDYTITAKDEWQKSLGKLDYNGSDQYGDFVWQYYITESLVDMNSYGVTYLDDENNQLQYVVRSVTKQNVTYDGMRLYPIDGAVTITNRSSSLKISKVWADGSEGSDSVTVNIYRTKTALQGSDLTAKTELVTSVVLNKDNSWSYTYPNAATYGFDFTEFKAYYFDYYVEEVGVDGYEASYSYSGGGECVPIKLETDGQSHIVYTASANVTITNTKIIPKVTVTKSFEDGNDNHSGEQVSVGLYAKIMQEWSDYLETESGVEAVTSYRTSYLLCDTAVLNKDNNWTVTWELNDIGVAYDTTWEKYTVDSYFVAELAHTNISSGESVSGYEPVVYSVGEDGELTRTVISETLNTYDYYYTLSGTPSYTDQDGNIHISKEVSSLTMNIPTQNIDLYPVSTNVVIDNVPTSQLTVNKKWADGTVPTAVKVQLFPVEYVSDSQGNTTYIPIDASRTDITGVQWEVTLSAENNWTYHWDNLPSTYSPAIYNELIGRYVKIKYCVRELAADSDVEKLTELIYTPVYTDGDGISLEGEAAIGDRTDERNLCVMRPADGIINITNELKTGKLTVIKTWNGIAESDKTSVTMNIYRQQYDIEHKQAENTPELIDSVVLSAENGWSTTLNDLPCFLVDSDGTVHSYDYFISELAGEGYSVTYTYSDSEEALTKRSFDSIDTSLYQIGFLADKQSYSVTVTNSEQYSLPHSGGIGTHLYTISGATILLIASLLYIAIKKRHRRRDKGGAY